MANNNSPKGLVPRYRKDGAKWDNTVFPVFYSSAHTAGLATGDPVALDGTHAPSGQQRGVTLAAFGANAVVSAVVQGIAGTLANGVASKQDAFDFWSVAGVNPSGNMSRPAGTSTRDYYINVSFTDPNVLYEVQLSNADVLALGSVGQTANLLAGADSSFTGLSGVTLNANSVAATGGQVTIYGFTPDSDPTSAYAKVLVYFNPAVEAID